jgi:hypothetical protein
MVCTSVVRTGTSGVASELALLLQPLNGATMAATTAIAATATS